MGELSIAPPDVKLLVQTPGASNAVFGDLTNSGTLQVDDPFETGGGTSVSASGTLTNSGTIAISGYYGTLTSADTITAGHLVNTGSVTLFGGAGPTGVLATFEDTGDAAPATLLGTLSLNRHAVFDFGAGGGVTSLGAGANLTLNSADSRLTAGGDASGNTALAGLASNAGTLLLNGAVIAPGTPAAFDNTGTLNLYNGASIGARTDLTNAGMLQVDDPFNAGGGTSVSVSGTLTNSGTIAISGYYGTLTSADTITAGHLVNTGSVTLFGGAGPTGVLATFEDTGDAAPATLLGTLSLNRHAVFDFGAGGGVTSLGAGANLTLNSADSRLTAGGDASGNTALAGLASNAGTLLLNGAVIAPGTPAAFDNTGTLNLYNGASIGARTDLTNAGMLQVDDPFNAGGGTSVSVSGTLTNSGTIAISGYYGTLTSADTITAGHLVNTGSVTLFGGAGPTGALATFEDTGDAAPATLLGTLSLNRHAVFDFGAGGGVTSLGAGANLTLNSADSRLTAGGDASGNTALAGLASNAGTLLLNGAVIAPGTPAAFGNTGTLNLYNGASIGARTDLTNAGMLQVDDPFNAGGGTSVSVSGTLTNSGTIAISGYYGPLTSADTITAGHLVNTGSVTLFGGAGPTGALATFEDTGDAAPATLLGTLSLNRHAVFDFGAGGGVTSLGAGASLTLNSADSRLTAGGDASGNTALAGLVSNAGTLLLNGAVIAPGTPAAFSNTGTLNLYNGASIGARTDLTNSGTLQVDDPFNAGGGTSVSVSGTLTNSGTIAISGYYGPLTAADTITAAHLVNTGSISLLGSANGTATLQAATASNTGTVTLSTGSVLSITGTAAYGQSTGTTQVDGTLSGNVGLSGGVLDGTGVVTGSVSTTGGIVRAGDQPSAPGTLTITGGLAESSSSTLEEDLAGTAGASEIFVTGGATVLDGTLQINALTGYTPTVGQSFTVLATSPGQLSGRFATLRYGNTLGNGTYVAVAQGVYLTVAYDFTAGTVTLQAVARPPIQVADPQISPTAIAFGNLHLGDTGTQALTVTNAAVQPADSLDASVTSVTGGVVATGGVTRLAPARSDAADIRVGIDTNNVGVKDGQATFALLSDSGGGVVAPLANQSVAVTGSVFRLASPSIDPVNAFVHVGDPGTFALTIRNADPADGYSEALDARVTGTAGRIAASGATALTLAPGASGTSVLISAATGSVGVQSGTVSLAFGSDGGTGAGSLDGLGVTALASQTVGVAVTVDNYAVPNFTLRDAGGLSAMIAGSGTATTLELGTIARGSGPLVLALSVSNAATGPADLLAGTILASGPGAFTTAGLDAFAGLGAGQTDAAPTVVFDTSADGRFTETLTLDGIGSNASGYSGALARRTLTITGAVADLPAPTITGLGSFTAIAGVATPLGSISLADADSDGTFIVTVSAIDGTLSAVALQDVTELGSGTSNLKLTGSLTAVNAALSSLTFKGTVIGSGQVILSVQDGHRANKSVTETVSILPMQPTLTVVNAPARLLLGVGSQSPALAGISISNPTAQASGAILSFQINSLAGLTLDETGVSGAQVSGRGTTSLTLTGTVDEINADLEDPVNTGDLLSLSGAEIQFVSAYSSPFDIIVRALQGDVDQHPPFDETPDYLAASLISSTGSLLKAIFDFASKVDVAEAFGDAHFATLSGRLLDFNAAGEFTLAHSYQSGNSLEFVGKAL